jgi:hypothetical protein
MAESDEKDRLRNFLNEDVSVLFTFNGGIKAQGPFEGKSKDSRPTLSVLFEGVSIYESLQKERKSAAPVLETVEFEFLPTGAVSVTSHFESAEHEELRVGKPAFSRTFNSVGEAIDYFYSSDSVIDVDNDPCRITKTSTLATLQSEVNRRLEWSMGFD